MKALDKPLAKLVVLHQVAEQDRGPHVTIRVVVGGGLEFRHGAITEVPLDRVVVGVDAEVVEPTVHVPHDESPARVTGLASKDIDVRIGSVYICAEELQDPEIDQVVKVDYIIPGCPPLPSMIKDTVVALVEGREPTIPSRNLCEECPRYHKDMIVPKLEFLTDTVTPVCELEHIDPDRCFLEQGVACAGLATHEGCDARCIKGNMPCRGCMGPTPGALEQGAKLINALGSLLPAGALMLLDDIVGMSYRFSVPVSIYPHLAGIKEKEVG